MTVMEAIRARRSIRRYEDRAVEEEKLRAVLEAGRLAPSARNMQEWRFVVVRDAETRRKMMEAANGQAFVGQAPVVLAGCALVTDHTMPCGQVTYPIDIAISVDHMTLKAVEEGLGTCWIGAFDEAKAKAALGVPANVRVALLLTLGYPTDQPPAKPRKPMPEFAVQEKWDGEPLQ